MLARQVSQVNVGHGEKFIAAADGLPQRGLRCALAVFCNGFLRPADGFAQEADEGNEQPGIGVRGLVFPVEPVDPQASLVGDQQGVVEVTQVVCQQIAENQRVLLGDQCRGFGATGKDRFVVHDAGHEPLALCLRTQFRNADDKDHHDAGRKAERCRTPEWPVGWVFAATGSKQPGAYEHEQDGGVEGGGGVAQPAGIADMQGEGGNQRSECGAKTGQAAPAGEENGGRTNAAFQVDEQGDGQKQQAEIVFRDGIHRRCEGQQSG